MATDFYTALNTVKTVLAADYACEESDFDTPGVHIYQAKELPGRRNFRFRKQSFAAATMGRGVVISCNLERLGWADANLGKLSRNDVFAPPAAGLIDGYVKKDGQYIAGPDLKHVCVKSNFKPCKPQGDVTLELIEDVPSLGLHGDKRFPNSLGLGHNPHMPWMVAAIAKCGGEIAGIASASADCDIMWQIGVDTLEQYRNRGIAKATVSAVTEYIMDHGVISYYSTFETNAASRATAAALGYKPAWVELYAREKLA
jgi:GNAT superfamily N-acetyltransferase